MGDVIEHQNKQSVHYQCIYGGPLNSASGGTKLQNDLFNALEAITQTSLSRHVVSSSEQAAAFVSGVQALPHPQDRVNIEVYLVDGLGAVWLPPHQVERLKRPSTILCAIVHFPFSTKFYEQEPWIAGLKPTADAALLDFAAAAGTSSSNPSSWLRSYEKLLFQTYDKLVAVGPYTAATLHDDFGISDEKIVVIGAPLTPLIDAFDLSRAMSLTPTRIDDSRKRVLKLVSVGTVCSRKRQATLIRAIKKVVDDAKADANQPAVHFVVVGNVDSEPSYANLCTSLCDGCSLLVGSGTKVIEIKSPLNGHSDSGACTGGGLEKSSDSEPPCSLTVEICGALSQEAALTHVAEADAFLFASRFESYGLAPLEAAALGVPVLTTPCGVLRDLLPVSSTLFVEYGGHLSTQHKAVGKGGAERNNVHEEDEDEEEAVAAWCAALSRLCAESSSLRRSAVENALGFRDAHRGKAEATAAQLHRVFTEPRGRR